MASAGRARVFLRRPDPLRDRQGISPALQAHHLFQRLAGHRAELPERVADRNHRHDAVLVRDPELGVNPRLESPVRGSERCARQVSRMF